MVGVFAWAILHKPRATSLTFPYPLTMPKPHGSRPIAHGLLFLLASAQASAGPIQAIRANYAAVEKQIAARAYHTQRKDGEVCGDISSEYTRWTDPRGVTRKLRATFYDDSPAMGSKAVYELWFDAGQRLNFALHSEGHQQTRFYVQRGRAVRVVPANAAEQAETWRVLQYLNHTSWTQLGQGC